MNSIRRHQLLVTKGIAPLTAHRPAQAAFCFAQPCSPCRFAIVHVAHACWPPRAEPWCGARSRLPVQVGTYTLGGDIFDVPIRRDILHRVVRWQLAKRQQGTHKTKGRSEVRGGGRKPRPQKGSGKSRQGTIRAPQW